MKVRHRRRTHPEQHSLKLHEGETQLLYNILAKIDRNGYEQLSEGARGLYHELQSRLGFAGFIETQD